jgi:hypothetical protein
MSAIVVWVSAADHARALPFYVRAHGQTSVSGVGIVEPGGLDSVDTGLIQALSASALPDTVSAATASGLAVASSSGSVSMGLTHGSASISADGVSVGSAAVSGGGTVQWGDTLTIVSGSLPLGTTVILEGTLTLHRTLVGSPGTTASVLATGPFGLSIGDSLTAPNATQSVSAIFPTTVGASLEVSGAMTWGTNGAAFAGAPVSASVDASNTARFSLAVLTPGASYSSASGETYAIPEPATGALGLMAMAILALFSRGRLPGFSSTVGSAKRHAKGHLIQPNVANLGVDACGFGETV